MGYKRSLRFSSIAIGVVCLALAFTSSTVAQTYTITNIGTLTTLDHCPTVSGPACGAGATVLLDTPAEPLGVSKLPQIRNKRHDARATTLIILTEG